MTFDYDPKTGQVHYVFTGPEVEELVETIRQRVWYDGYSVGLTDGQKNTIVKRMDEINKKRKEKLKTNG